jgi:hypothetical protein
VAVLHAAPSAAGATQVPVADVLEAKRHTAPAWQTMSVPLLTPHVVDVSCAETHVFVVASQARPARASQVDWALEHAAPSGSGVVHAPALHASVEEQGWAVSQAAPGAPGGVHTRFVVQTSPAAQSAAAQLSPAFAGLVHVPQ